VTAAYAATGLILAGCCAYAWCVLAGHEQPVRTAVIRARWAWACRKPPARTEGKLSRAEYLTFIGLVETWRQSDAPERTRT
jgi:hypothetical protein